MVALAGIAALYPARGWALPEQIGLSLSTHNSLLNPRFAATAETHGAVEVSASRLRWGYKKG